MTELKTLKDLERTEYHQHLVSEWVLREEAIKWVKNCNCSKRLGYCRACIRFRIFFNITENDLI